MTRRKSRKPKANGRPAKTHDKREIRKKISFSEAEYADLLRRMGLFGYEGDHQVAPFIRDKIAQFSTVEELVRQIKIELVRQSLREYNSQNVLLHLIIRAVYKGRISNLDENAMKIIFAAIENNNKHREDLNKWLL